MKACLKFAKNHIEKNDEFWKKILWPVETRTEFFGQNNTWRESGEVHLLKNTVPPVKYGGGSLMFWGYFTAKGLGHLVTVDGMMRKKQYIDILSHILRESSTEV